MAERSTRRRWWALMLTGLMTLSGCSGFFPPVTTTGSGSGSGSGSSGSSSTTNLAYLANSSTNSVSGFAVGTGTLTSAPNMPFALGFTPQAEVVASNYLYVAGPGAIYAYAVGSDGSLSTVTAGAVLVYALAMDVSPDGNWLVALDGLRTQLDVMAINRTTGALTLAGTAPYSIVNATVSAKAVKVSPDGTLIVAALGTGGDEVFTFNAATGAAVTGSPLPPVSNQTSDNALAIDSTTTHLYIARSGSGGGLAVYTIGSGGVLTSVAGSPFSAGTQPLSVVVNGADVYVANGSDGTIAGYSVTNGVATPLSGSPYASGAEVRSLAIDKSGAYLLAAAQGGSPDLTMYRFDATVAGKLDQVATAATGTDPAGAIVVATTH